MTAPLQFEAGQRFGELTVLRFDAEKSKPPTRYWLCDCSCDKQTSVRGTCLVNGTTKSCGHLLYQGRPKTHGDTCAREYNIWVHMIQRCYNPKRDAYYRYGARGISVCGRWRNDYSAFLADMGRAPFKDAQIDRIDNDGNYEPGNCRWATRKEQGGNKSNVVYFEYEGRRQKASEWAEELGVPAKAFRQRVWKGWTPEEVVSGRRAKEHGCVVRRITHDGLTLPVNAWAQRLGIPRKTIHTRIDRGWSDSEIVTGKRSKGEQQ